MNMAQGKEILTLYRRFARLTGSFYTYDELQVLTIEEYSTKLPVRPVSSTSEYFMEKMAILKAWQQLREHERLVLYYSYFSLEKFSIAAIADEINYSKKSVEVFKRSGIENFVTLYKNGILH